MEDSPVITHFSDALTALSDVEVPFPARYLHSFTDLSRKQLRDFKTVWEILPPSRKVSLLEDLEDIAEKDTLVNFDDLAKAVITDFDPKVRVMAIRLLWECEDSRLVPTLIDIFRGDEDESVRAAAASLLGRFVLLGEWESISESVRISVINNLIDAVDGVELPQVKQRALESLGYSSHPLVPIMIKRAFASEEITWVTAALCAMGRSADDSWASLVESKLDSPDVEVQFEAIRAAGELELASSREKLLALLEEDVVSADNRLAAIWALSQIGGDEVKEKLNSLLVDAIDDDEIEWIERAIENLELSSPAGLDLLAIQDKDAEDLDPDENEDEDEDDEYDDDVDEYDEN